VPDLSNIDLQGANDVYDVGQPRVQLGFVDAVFIAAVDVISNAPTLSGWNPPLGSAVSKRQTISFTVTPTAPNDLLPMRRVLLLASFPPLNLYEVVHDGDAFSQAYPTSLGNVRTANGLGFDFTVLREEGWPASPRFIPVAVDVYGAITPITNVVYAWTLV